MIVIRRIMAVTVQDLVKVMLEPVRMAMLGHGLEVILDGLENGGRVFRTGQDRPQCKRQAHKRRERHAPDPAQPGDISGMDTCHLPVIASCPLAAGSKPPVGPRGVLRVCLPF